MDFCIGGDLFFHSKKIKRFSEDEARIYFIEILLALEYLHSKNIIYRDLKVMIFFNKIFLLIIFKYLA